MKRKTLIIATFLVATLAIGSTAQAHDDFGYPVGLLSGVILGLSLDQGDHHHYYYDRDRPNRHYHHRDYRRHDSHGYQYRDHFKRNHGYDRHHDRHDRR